MRLSRTNHDNDDDNNANNGTNEGHNAAQTWHSRRDIPTSQQNGCSEILIVLGSCARGYVSLTWTAASAHLRIYMHQVSSKRTESAGIRS